MARREDYLLSRLLLTDGTVSFNQLSDILLRWNEKSSKSLFETLTDEQLISEEEGRGLMMCIEKLADGPEEAAALAKIDFILCQLVIQKKLATPELVSEYQRKTPKDLPGLPAAEALLKEGKIPGNAYVKLKRSAEKVFYHRQIVGLVRKQIAVQTFSSPRKDEGEETTRDRKSRKIQTIITHVRADVDRRPKNAKRRKTAPIPKLFGNYEILDEIAAGGMGMVYKAKHTSLGRVVALKVLHEEEETPDRIKRFLREADAAGMLKHPNIVGIHDRGDVKGRHFLCMDYVDGLPLNTLIKEGKNVELEDYLNIAAELARALHYAHQKEVIHRDIKPANILIDMEGHPQITDFGLAKLLGAGFGVLTRPDTIIGTPFYMAPEQTRGENDQISAQTDVWALGIILYEMITKRLPFTGKSSIELYHKINHIEPVPPRKVNPQIPEDVEGIIRKAIAKDAEDRYSSAEAMAQDIEKYLDGEKLVFREPPLIWKKFRRWYRQNKWLLLIAFLAVLFGWICGWYILNTAR